MRRSAGSFNPYCAFSAAAVEATACSRAVSCRRSAAACLRHHTPAATPPPTHTPTRPPQKVIFYDMGSGSTEVALVKYSTYSAREPGSSKPKPINQFEVLDADWDATLGANALDGLLADHFAAKFDENTGLGDVRCAVFVCFGGEGGVMPAVDLRSSLTGCLDWRRWWLRWSAGAHAPCVCNRSLSLPHPPGWCPRRWPSSSAR